MAPAKDRVAALELELRNAKSAPAALRDMLESLKDECKNDLNVAEMIKMGSELKR